MAFNRLFLIIAIVALAFPSVTKATEFLVGDESGWTPDHNYTAWAQDKVFHVGDVLVFNYTKNKHNVITVNGTAFKNCTIPPNGAHNTSLDRIKLQAPGKKWYICGIADHCAEHGMKLVIDVQGAAPPPAPNHTAPPPAPIHKAPPPAPIHEAPPPAPNNTAPAPAPNHTAPRTFSGYQIIASALILVAMVMA